MHYVQNVPFPRPIFPEFTWVNPVVDATVKTWTPIWNQEAKSSYMRPAYGRMGKLDVMNISEPEIAWFWKANVEPAVISWTPIWDQEGKSSYMRPAYGRRDKLDVMNVSEPEPAWFWKGPVEPIVVTWLPIWDEENKSSYRTPDYGRKQKLDVTSVPEPEPAWLNSVVTPALDVAPLGPIWNQEMSSSYRTPDYGSKQKLDVTNVSEPEFILGYLDIDAFNATLRPVWDEQKSSAYMTNRRRAIDTANISEPQPAWFNSVVDADIAKRLPPIYQAITSFLLSQRRVLDVEQMNQGNGALYTVVVSAGGITLRPMKTKNWHRTR